MEERSSPSSSTVKIGKLLLKIAITVACLWYISTKIDFKELGQILLSTNWLFLAIAFLIFIISKIVASYRLNMYFRSISLFISEKENLKLFWLGMFYNLFLPGSITGDAYKVILLSKRFGLSYRKTTTAVLLDRFSGLLGLGAILALYAFLTLDRYLYVVLLATGALLAIFGLYFIVRRYFRDFFSVYWPTFFTGLIVQVLMVACVYAIMYALHVSGSYSEYAFIFLIAAIAGVLPLTIGGGLGIREFVFYKGAIFFGLNEQTAIVISLLFYFVTAISSLFGSIFVFKPVFTGNLPATNTTAKHEMGFDKKKNP